MTWLARNRGLLVVAATTAVVGVLIGTLAQWGSDWPAQQFRAWVADGDPFTVWANQWYGGLPLAGYSVLYPLGAWLLGAAGVGVAALVVGTAVGGALGSGLAPRRRLLFQASVALELTVILLIGQVTALLGFAFGLAALLAVLRRSPGWLVGLLALACSLSSPLIGLFLLIAGPAVVTVVGVRRGLWLVPALLGVGFAAVIGGAEGPDPYGVLLLVETLAFCLLVVTLDRRRTVIVFAGTYALAAVVLASFPNAVGGNLLRLASTAALPVIVWLVPAPTTRRLRAVGVVCCAVVTVWPALGVGASLIRVDDPSRQASYYSGLLRFLRTRDPSDGRLEIPFTRSHWEAQYVARRFPLARGWERQTDLLYNEVLYHPLTSTSYRSWLADNAVALVALPTAPLDGGGQAERDLLRRPPSYLTWVWGDQHWTVWAVQGARPLASGPARVTALTTSSVTLQFTAAGTSEVRVRYARSWQADNGACVAPAAGHWLTVRAARPGRVVLSAGVSSLLGSASGC